MRRFTSFITLALILSACSEIPPSAYSNRGGPESLIDVSSEIVNLDIGSEQTVDELMMWIEQDHPSRAEVYCIEATRTCQGVLDMMELFGVPHQYIPSAENMATLVYERVLARDCSHRYIDNSVNPYHLNHPAFGCSIAANMVQMATDKQQFVRPNLLDKMDAKKAIQGYRNYSVRREISDDLGIADSLLDSARQN